MEYSECEIESGGRDLELLKKERVWYSYPSFSSQLKFLEDRLGCLMFMKMKSPNMHHRL